MRAVGERGVLAGCLPVCGVARMHVLECVLVGGWVFAPGAGGAQAGGEEREQVGERGTLAGWLPACLL